MFGSNRERDFVVVLCMAGDSGMDVCGRGLKMEERVDPVYGTLEDNSVFSTAEEAFQYAEVMWEKLAESGSDDKETASTRDDVREDCSLCDYFTCYTGGHCPLEDKEGEGPCSKNYYEWKLAKGKKARKLWAKALLEEIRGKHEEYKIAEIEGGETAVKEEGSFQNISMEMLKEMVANDLICTESSIEFDEELVKETAKRYNCKVV